MTTFLPIDLEEQFILVLAVYILGNVFKPV